MIFEWNQEKNKINQDKHGISFEEAKEVFELKENYDFSGGVRGRFYKPKKVPTSMRLDDDILLFLKKQKK